MQIKVYGCECERAEGKQYEQLHAWESKTANLHPQQQQ